MMYYGIQAFPLFGFVMPEAFRNKISNHSALSPHRLSLMEHWETTACDYVVEFSAQPDGHMICYLIINFYLDEFIEVPRGWEAC